MGHKTWMGKTKIEERRKFLELVREGLSIRAAARLVGVNGRTGQEWIDGRNERVGTTKPGRKRLRPAIAPITGAGVGHSRKPGQSAPVSLRYLSEAERIHIADRLRDKASIRVIAGELGRSPSTVSREIRRNGVTSVGRQYPVYYRPFVAQHKAQNRRPRPKRRKIDLNPELHDFIQARLDKRWSPEQIANMLRKQHPDQPHMHVTHETIYRTLYARARGGLRREIARRLRTGRTYRKPRRQAQQRNPRFTHPMTMIEQRPAEATDRAVPGHWEGDLIIGEKNGSAIGTLVERTTRNTLLVHLPHGRRPDLVHDALAQTVGALPAVLKRSLTWDHGAEMAYHHSFSKTTGLPVYFCQPRSPWQRGTNENTNGLLRQYFPKGTDLSQHTHHELERVMAELNSRPRKGLGWDTPAESRHTGLRQHMRGPRPPFC